MKFVILDKELNYELSEHREIRAIKIQGEKYALRAELIFRIKDNSLREKILDLELVEFKDVKFLPDEEII